MYDCMYGSYSRNLSLFKQSLNIHNLLRKRKENETQFISHFFCYFRLLDVYSNGNCNNNISKSENNTNLRLSFISVCFGVFHLNYFTVHFYIYSLSLCLAQSILYVCILYWSDYVEWVGWRLMTMMTIQVKLQQSLFQ